MFQANNEDTRIALNVSVLVTFLTSTLNMFLFAEVFSEAAVREFSKKYMVQLLYSKNRKVKPRSYSSSQGHKNILMNSLPTLKMFLFAEITLERNHHSEYFLKISEISK